MTTVTDIPEGATGRLPDGSHSTNGDPPVAPGGTSVLVVVGIAFVLGIVVAKLIDRRAHAHPRD